MKANWKALGIVALVTLVAVALYVFFFFGYPLPPFNR